MYEKSVCSFPHGFIVKHSFTAFGIYRIVLGVIVLLLQGFVK